MLQFVFQIDEDVVQIMTDSELKLYIPKAGDRIALRRFLSSSNSNSSFETRKIGLMEKLRDRLRSRKAEGPKTEGPGSSQDHEQSGKRLRSNNKKDEVSISLGWMNFNEKSGQFAQVRLISGGGTRQLHMSKTATKKEIQETAEGLFFPHGISSKGSLDEFHRNLTDFKADEVDESHSLADWIEKTKIYKLRFYLTTQKKSLCPDDDECSGIEKLKGDKTTAAVENDQNLIQKEMDKTTEKKAEILTTDLMGRQEEVATSCSSSGDTVVELLDLCIPRNNNDNGAAVEIQSKVSLIEPIVEPIAETVWIDPLGEVYIDGFKPMTDPPRQFHVEIHRGHAFSDLRKFFKDNTSVNPGIDVVKFTLILPNGDHENAADSGGVTRDILTEFWQEFYECCTLGYEIKVPILRHDFEKEDWASIACVLAFGWILEKMLPDQLAPSFLNTSFTPDQWCLICFHIREQF